LTPAKVRKDAVNISQRRPTKCLLYTFHVTHIGFGCMDGEENLETYTRHCGNYCQ